MHRKQNTMKIPENPIHNRLKYIKRQILVAHYRLGHSSNRQRKESLSGEEKMYVFDNWCQFHSI